MKYYVTDTPWAIALPNGTEILKAETPEGKEGYWFTGLDKKPIFKEDPSYKFKLFPEEFKTEEDE